MNGNYVVTPIGSTGIGTCNPSAKLHIVGNNASLIGTYDIKYVMRVSKMTLLEQFEHYRTLGYFK